jgi:hypothetical protein
MLEAGFYFCGKINSYIRSIKIMDQEKQLSESVQELTKQFEKSNSFWRNLGRGIFFGIGSAIGASFIAAIIIGILARIFNLFQTIPELFK